jgi:outer membrane protein
MKYTVLLIMIVNICFAKVHDIVDIYNSYLQNNESYKISELKTKYYDKEIDKSLSAFYPKISLDTEYMKINEFPVVVDGVEQEKRRYRRDITVNVEQIIYNRSQYFDYKIKDNEYLQSSLQNNQEHQNLIFDVIRYYLETVLKSKQIDLTEQKLNRLNVILKRAKLKYESGFISKADYLEAKAQRDELLTQKTQLELDYNITKSFLEKFCGINNLDIKRNINIDKLNNVEFKNFIYDINNNLDVQLQKLKLTKTEIQKKQSLSKFEPTLSLNYEYITNDVPGIENDRTLKLVFKVNIFNGFYDYKNYEQSQISKIIEELTFNKLLKDMKQNIQNKTDTINAYFEIISSYPEILKSKKFSLDGMQERFNLGTKSIIDLLDEENKYFEKLNTFVEYQHQLLLEYTELNRYTNTLNLSLLNQINGLIYE